MARFGSEADLAAFLGKLDQGYSWYAAALWQTGIRPSRQLSNASRHISLSAGLPQLHTDDIKARAEGVGEQLAYSNLLQHHDITALSSKQWLPDACTTQECEFIMFSETGFQTSHMLPCNFDTLTEEK